MSSHKLGTYAEFKEQVAKVIDDPFQVAKEKLEIKWVVGGMSGGDCWGGEAKYSREAEPEPPFENLDKILEYYVPTISYLQYKKLLSELKTNNVEFHNEYEYYGNSYNYAIKSVYLKELYDYLFKLGAN